MGLLLLEKKKSDVLIHSVAGTQGGSIFVGIYEFRTTETSSVISHGPEMLTLSH